ncbi:AbrB family transcriptional regulator [Alloalcanivorax sp. C16-1]|uniref:AbrB family transcriptional regulator n=1 Tax=Alloalcanivorax sp. C16-1 TaxID=3390051 RepID=UPI003970C2C5
MLLILLSAGAATLMRLLTLPAAFMLGPMVAGVVIALSGGGLRLHRNFSVAAQSVMGCLIAGFITPQLLAAYRDHWLMLTTLNLSTMAVIVLISVAIARRRWLPDTTAIWGLFPGAASAMVLLADAHHSDPRVVAMMQYSRIVLVSVASIAMAALLEQTQGAAHAGSGGLPVTWSLPTAYLPVVAALALAIFGYTLSKISGNGTLALLIPAFAGTALQGAGVVTIEVPPALFIPAFTLTGWYVGLTFTRAAIKHCLKLLPIMLAAAAVVILMCGLMAVVLTWLVPGMDLLTAYLSLSPGGIETIIIIAREADVVLPLILASQFLRLLMVLSIGPRVARTVAVWQSRHPPIPK